MTDIKALSESEITKKLEKEGYSNVSLQRAPAQMGGAAGSGQTTGGVSGTAQAHAGASAAGAVQQKSGAADPERFTGTASKNGKQVRFEVDSSGKVTEK